MIISNITSKETFHKDLLESYSKYDLEVKVDEEYIYKKKVYGLKIMTN